MRVVANLYLFYNEILAQSTHELGMHSYFGSRMTFAECVLFVYLLFGGESWINDPVLNSWSWTYYNLHNLLSYQNNNIYEYILWLSSIFFDSSCDV